MKGLFGLFDPDVYIRRIIPEFILLNTIKKAGKGTEHFQSFSCLVFDFMQGLSAVGEFSVYCFIIQ